MDVYSMYSMKISQLVSELYETFLLVIPSATSQSCNIIVLILFMCVLKMDLLSQWDRMIMISFSIHISIQLHGDQPNYHSILHETNQNIVWFTRHVI